MIASAMDAIPAPASDRPTPIPEGRWWRCFSHIDDWIRNTYKVMRYLIQNLVPGQTWVQHTSRVIAEAIGCSIRWVDAALNQLEEWGLIRRYWHYGPHWHPDPGRRSGRRIEITLAPKGWFAGDAPTDKPKGKARAAPATTGRTPSKPYTAEELARAAPPSKEDEAAAEAAAAARQVRAKGIWDSLTERQRREIRAQVEEENPGLDRRWGSMLEGMCLVRAEAEYGPAAATPEDPRPP